MLKKRYYCRNQVEQPGANLLRCGYAMTKAEMRGIARLRIFNRRKPRRLYSRERVGGNAPPVSQRLTAQRAAEPPEAPTPSYFTPSNPTRGAAGSADSQLFHTF